MRTHSLSRVGVGLVLLESMTLGCSGESPTNSGTGGSPPTTGGVANTAGIANTAGAANVAGVANTAGAANAGGTTSGSGGVTTGGSAGGTGIGTGGAGGASAGAGGFGTGGSAGGGGGGASGAAGASGQPSGGSGGGSGDPSKSAGCGSMNPLKSGQATIDVGGMSRQYTLRVPDNYDPNHAYRLIFSFHWLNGTMQNIANGSGTAKAYYGLWDLANGSTIFVAPQGINNGWSDSGRSSTKGGQDIQLTQALYDKITTSMCIDKTRVFSEGFSMGGSMSYAIACALPDLFRAVAVHSGGPMSGCVQHSRPVAYFMTHGINDSVCTYPGYGVPQVNDFAKVNGCMAATLPTPTSAQASCIDFQGCTAGHPTRGCTFVGDHTPSPPNVNSTWVPAETWKFISQF